MIWLTVDKKGNEEIHSNLPIRIEEDEEIGFWLVRGYKQPYIKVPKGTIEKLIGKKLSWEDEPYKLDINLIFKNNGKKGIGNW